MSSLTKALKRSLATLSLSLHHFGIIVEEHTHGNGKHGVDYIRGQAKSARVIAHYDENVNGLKVLDMTAQQALIEQHATAFKALMGDLAGLTVEARPMSEEEVQVQKLKVWLLNS